LLQLEPQVQTAQGYSEAPARRFFSTNFGEAACTLQAQAKAAVDGVVDQSDKAVEKMFDALKDKADDILEGFEKLGNLFTAASNVGVLLRKTLEKVLSALQALRDIVKTAPIEQSILYLKQLVAQRFGIRGVLQEIYQSAPLSKDIGELHIDKSVVSR
jgi:hypothetical protein